MISKKFQPSTSFFVEDYVYFPFSFSKKINKVLLIYSKQVKYFCLEKKNFQRQNYACLKDKHACLPMLFENKFQIPLHYIILQLTLNIILAIYPLFSFFKSVINYKVVILLYLNAF